jgi:hypothetical protein
MDVNDAEKFVNVWCIWERGRSDGIDQTIAIVEKLLCCNPTTAQQRETLLWLYDSLLETKGCRSGLKSRSRKSGGRRK